MTSYTHNTAPTEFIEADGTCFAYRRFGDPIGTPTRAELEGGVAAQMIRLLEALEDLDDVQNVYSNFDLDASQYEEVAG